jgi:tetratricopeptide (TPR) repeat protein
VSTNRRRSLLNFIIGTAVVTTLVALLSPLAIAWWKNSTFSNSRLPAVKVNELNSQIIAAEKTLQVQPDDPAALKNMIQAKSQLHDLKGSLNPLTKLAAVQPDKPEYTVLLGQTQQYLGDRESAAASYNKVLKNQPQNIQALQGLVSLLIDLNKPEAAIGYVQTAINTASTGGSAVDTTPHKLLLAQIHVSQQRNDRALPIYDELIQANNQDFRPVLARGIAVKKMGKIGEAQTLLSQAAELAPTQYKDQIQSLAKSAVLPISKNTVAIPAPSLAPATSGAPVPSPLNSPMPILSPSASVPIKK